MCIRGWFFAEQNWPVHWRISSSIGSHSLNVSDLQFLWRQQTVFTRSRKIFLAGAPAPDEMTALLSSVSSCHCRTYYNMRQCPALGWSAYRLLLQKPSSLQSWTILIFRETRKQTWHRNAIYYSVQQKQMFYLPRRSVKELHNINDYVN